MVEVAGIEPASPDVSMSLLRAQSLCELSGWKLVTTPDLATVSG